MRIINSTSDSVDIRFTRKEYNDFLQLLDLENHLMLELIGFDPRVETDTTSKEDSFNLLGGYKCETKAKVLQGK